MFLGSTVCAAEQAGPACLDFRASDAHYITPERCVICSFNHFKPMLLGFMCAKYFGETRLSKNVHMSFVQLCCWAEPIKKKKSVFIVFSLTLQDKLIQMLSVL